jgi:ribosomal protein S18 acetylase RimI-like enzyme
MADAHPLDDPVRAALDGPQRALADRAGRVMRFPADIGPFGALPAEPTDDDWRDLAGLTPASVVVVGEVDAPYGWRGQHAVPALQMVLPDAVELPVARVEPLGPADVDAMLDLVARTQPGPFERRTIELGGYIGVRDGGELVAMAGERMRPPGWTEISAVCVSPEHRGRGLARRVVSAVAGGIRDRGDRPMLHVSARNDRAIALYESMGFVVRREIALSVLVRA